MKHTHRYRQSIQLRRLRLAGLLAVTLGCVAFAPAADTPAAPTPTSSIDPSNTPRSSTPIDFFRHLLSLTPAERQAALSTRNEPQRSVLLRKISEYEAMPARERNHRLRLLEVRLHLLPLMKLNPGQREPALKRIPQNDLAFVQTRLKEWDTFEPPRQQQILTSEMRLHYFMYRDMGQLKPSQADPRIIPPATTAAMEQAIADWKGLTDLQRTLWASHMKQFMAMSQANRQRVLDHVPQTRRPQVQLVIQQLDSLSPPQRNLTVDGFHKFANLNVAQRRRFIHFAERWQKMTSSERSHWRQIAAAIPTPPVPGRVE